MPNETVDYFDVKWEHLKLKQGFPNSDKKIECPELLSKMLQFAKILSIGFPFIRTDFYIINGKLYFSELTFYSDAGFAEFEPNEWDLKLGNKIIL